MRLLIYITLPERLVEMLGTKELEAIVADDRVMLRRTDEFPEEVLHGDALYM